MFYFEKKADRIEKFDVTYDEIQMNKLRSEIIDKCSEISHYELFGKETERYEEDPTIRNLQMRSATKKEFLEHPYCEEYELYHYSYDQYKFPYLVTLIDLLHRGYGPAIKEILTPTFRCEFKTVKEGIEDLTKKANSISDSNSNEKKEVLEELNWLMRKANLNANQISVKEYYPKVKALITMEHIDSIAISDFERIKDFFEINIDIYGLASN